MKNKLLIVFLLLLTLLAGCGSSYTTKISFDNILLELKSSKLYIPKTIDSTKYPGISIYEEKKADTQDTFTNSLIVSSQENINLKTKDFANKNMNNLKAGIESIKVQSTKILSFNCSGEKITGIVKYFTNTQNKKNIYFSQFFFTANNKGYIRSFESDNEQDNTDFRTSLAQLSCTK